MAEETPNANASTLTLTMKLLVDTKAQRVLYAEGSKDGRRRLPPLPPGPPARRVTKLLTAGAMVGSVGNLYGSVENLGEGYAYRGDVKAALLASTVLRLDSPDAASSSTAKNGAGALYRCFACSGSCRNFVTKVNATPCPVCRSKMTSLVRLVEPDDVPGGAKSARTAPAASDEASCKGHVPAGTVTYTVMDDLTVSPSSTVSAIAALVALGVMDIRGLKQKIVEVGYNEGLAVLKASLQSKTVLTDVFL